MYRQRAHETTSKVLIVDNDLMSRLILERQVDRLGYVPVTASNAADALLAVAVGDIAFVLMDIEMPGMDGYETTRQLRLQDGGRLAIVACTANVGPGARRQCLQSGMDAYLAKPVQLDDLKKVLRRFLPPPQAAASPWRWDVSSIGQPAYVPAQAG